MLDTILKTCQMVLVASCEGDQPRLRPMTLIWWDQRFWLATGSRDNKTRQLQNNPKLEWCLLIPGDGCTGYLRGCATVLPIKDIKLRKDVAEASGFIYNYWKDATDEDFILYELQSTKLRWMPPGAMYEEEITL